MKTITFATLVAAAMLTGCSSSKTIAPLTSLAGEWTIEKIDGNAIDKKAGDNVPFMGFDTTAKRIYGNTGCNSLTGELKADNGKINLSIKRLEPKPQRENAPRGEFRGNGGQRREGQNSRPNRAPVQPAAPKTADQLFEEKLKAFMSESDSKISSIRQYSDHRTKSRRR